MIMNNDIETLQNRFNSLCDEQDKYYHKEFEDVFAIIFEMDKNTTKDYPFLTETATQQAIEKAGYMDDKAFVSDFLEYERIFKEGKNVQRQMLELLAESIPSEQEEPTNEWRFVSIKIIAPQPIMQLIDEVVMKEVFTGKGLFANFTDIPDEDEELDSYLMIEAYGLKCSLVPFHDDLKEYGIIGDDFFSKDFTKILFQILVQEIEFIKDNTDAPAKVKNHISKTIKALDVIHVWGLFFQILTLQGLCRWFEEIDINDGDNGYKEAQSLYNWICMQLAPKEIEFCYKPYGENDKERLKPLCNYLYSTELGKLVQSQLFGTNEPQQTITQELGAETQMPEELNTQQANNLFAKAIEAGFVEKTNEGYRWKGATKQLLAYFVERASIYLNLRVGKLDKDDNQTISWQPFNKVFGVKDIKRYKNDWMKLNHKFTPKGYENIDKIFD